MKSIMFQIVGVTTAEIYGEYCSYEEAEEDARLIYFNGEDVYIRKVFKND